MRETSTNQSAPIINRGKQYEETVFAEWLGVAVRSLVAVGRTGGWRSRSGLCAAHRQSLDPSFKPRDFGIRSAGLKAVQPDSRILISRQTLERLNADGSPDPSFAPALSGTANSLLLQPDGRMVLDGGSTNLDGTRRNYLVRLNADGSLDASFTPGVMTNRLSFALAGLPDGGILAGGNFYQANDEIHVGLARFNQHRRDATVADDAGWRDGQNQRQRERRTKRAVVFHLARPNQFSSSLRDRTWRGDGDD